MFDLTCRNKIELILTHKRSDMLHRSGAARESRESFDVPSVENIHHVSRLSHCHTPYTNILKSIAQGELEIMLRTVTSVGGRTWKKSGFLGMPRT